MKELGFQFRGTKLKGKLIYKILIDINNKINKQL